MKIVAMIARILLGLMFVFSGLNGFLRFIPTPPLTGLVGQMNAVIFESKYWVVIFGCQLIGGVLLLVNRYVPLGLVILGPVIVNILCMHFLIMKQGQGVAIVVALLWSIVAWQNRRHLEGIFAQRT